MYKPLVAFVLAASFAAPSWSAPQSVTLSVPGMTCPACPITVRKSLSRVAGVTDVTVNLEAKEATVTYDDAQTSVDSLIRATTDAGYPSTPRKAATR